MKIAIIGHAGHGKDTFSAMLAKEMGTNWESSSNFATRQVIMPVLGPKYGYTTDWECHQDRHNHRKEWYDLIAVAARNNQFADKLLNCYDIYCGCRSYDELEAMRHRLECTVWVDASERLPPEKTESCTVTRDQADYTIPNNGSLDELKDRAIKLAHGLSPHK